MDKLGKELYKLFDFQKYERNENLEKLIKEVLEKYKKEKD